MNLKIPPPRKKNKKLTNSEYILNTPTYLHMSTCLFWAKHVKLKLDFNFLSGNPTKYEYDTKEVSYNNCCFGE